MFNVTKFSGVIVAGLVSVLAFASGCSADVDAMGSTSEAVSTSGQFLAQRELDSFSSSTAVLHHFQGTYVLPAGQAPINGNFGTAYTACKSKADGSGWTDNSCAANFAANGFYLLHTAYYWQSPGVYSTATTQPAQYTVESSTLKYDAATRTVTYDLTLRYSYTCAGQGCQYAPVIVGSLYANTASNWLSVYDDTLNRGPSNYLLTGDGEQVNTTVSLQSPNAFAGTSALEVRTTKDSGYGTHWKTMLFANGNAASATGIDLTGYSKIEFMVATNRPGGVVLQSGIGSGDDSASRGFAPINVTTTWTKQTFDLSGMNRTRINSLLWFYMHKSSNPFDYTGVAVYLDNVRFIP